jgi:hypothetical protein
MVPAGAALREMVWHKGDDHGYVHGTTTGNRSCESRQGVRRHVISVLVENRVSVLARVAGLFTGRGFNIESLAVAATGIYLSRMSDCVQRRCAHH